MRMRGMEAKVICIRDTDDTLGPIWVCKNIIRTTAFSMHSQNNGHDVMDILLILYSLSEIHTMLKVYISDYISQTRRACQNAYFSKLCWKCSPCTLPCPFAWGVWFAPRPLPGLANLPPLPLTVSLAIKTIWLLLLTPCWLQLCPYLWVLFWFFHPLTTPDLFRVYRLTKSCQMCIKMIDFLDVSTVAFTVHTQWRQVSPYYS